ncbi:MAG TPA: hypothetical protein VN838_23780 [Bradyrhizobium sp.]|nr:hypothetical protein [Bradyrhizobium sp.]
MFRFVLYAVIACITAFAGVSWAVRGFPNPGKAFETAVTSPVAAPKQTRVTTTFAKDYHRKMWEEAEDAARNDRDPKLDRVRMEALQTADAYAMAPCGEFTRLNLIAALTAYTQAWQDRVKDCPRLMTVPLCGDKKVREVSATFSTPLDLRAQAALSLAFAKGGIVIDDFPAEVRRDALQFGGPGLQYRTVAACGVRHRSATR